MMGMEIRTRKHRHAARTLTIAASLVWLAVLTAMILTVALLASTIGYGETDQTVTAAAVTTVSAPVTATPATWFEPRPDGTWEGITGDPSLRPADAVDAVTVTLGDGVVDPRTVAELRAAGCFAASGESLTCPLGLTVGSVVVTVSGAEPTDAVGCYPLDVGKPGQPLIVEATDTGDGLCDERTV